MWVNQAVNGVFSGAGNGRSFVVGLSTAGGINIPCWRDLGVGGAAVWLDDFEAPAQPVVKEIPEGWLKKASSHTLTVEAYDPGLGVQEVRLIAPGEKRWPWNQTWCTGLYGDRCPASRSGQLTFSTEAFMEGTDPVSVNAVSPSGKIGPARSFELKIDGTAPGIKLSGQFAKATAGSGIEKLDLPVYNLTVKAEDLLGAGPSMGSGVKEVTVLIDGKVVVTKAASCTSSSCPGTFETTVEVPLTNLGEGEHTLEVKAKDFVGNETQPEISKIGFEYFPATGMKEDYVLQHFILPDGHDYSGEAEYHGPELAVNVMNGNVVYRERDLQVQAPSGNLDLERIYNSQQPSSRDGQWGHGWSLAQTPEFKPSTGEGSAQTATMVKTSAVTNPVQLPQSQEQTTFNSELHATVAQVAGAGYEVTSATGEEASVFNSSGRIEETRLSSVSPETTVEPEPVFPAFVESLGSSGSGNGQLSHPADVAADAKGNLWVVDGGNNRIEEFNEAGEFLRTAGASGSGAGQLKSPSGIAIDSVGNLDVTDTGNNRVVTFGEKGEFISAVGWNVNKTKAEGGGTQAEKNRCTAASGNVCQAGTAGSLEGQMAEPVGITTVGAQDFFVVERANNRVEKFNPQGELLMKFGSSGSGGSQMTEPTGIAYSAAGGYLWVTDTGNNRLEKWTTAGVSSGKVGWEGSAPGLFKRPSAIEVDAEGNLYVADPGNQRVQMLSRAGDYIAQFGTEGQLGLGPSTGIFATSAGELWVTDTEAGRLQKWLTGASVLWSSRIGSLGSGNGQFSHPSDVAIDSKGNIWALDQGNGRGEKFNEKGEFLTTFGGEGGTPWKLSQPSALAIDQSNDAWVADTSKNRIVEFNEAGQFVLTFGLNVNKTKVDAGGTEAERNLCTAASGNFCQAGTAGSTGAQLRTPKGIAIASDGSVLVSDTGNNRLKKFSPTGTLLATGASEGSAGGQVKEPMGIAVAPDKSIWVADLGNNRIEQWSSSLAYVRQVGSQGSGNRQFKQPAAIDVDSSGNIWVGDQINDRVEELTSTGQYVAQYGDSSQFSFGRPMGLVTDGRGNLWVTDSEHNRLQKLSTSQFAKPLATQAPALDYSYSSGLLTKMELKEPEAPDPSIAVTNSSGLASTVSSEAGTASYSYTSGNLTSAQDPSGQAKFEWNAGNRIKKVELPNGTWAKIIYDSTGRAIEVTAKPAGGTEKTTHFWYGTEPRETRVWGGGIPETIYSIGENGEVLKWWYKETPPVFEGFGGSLWANRNSITPIENKDHLFYVTAKSQNEIASVQLLVNGTSVVEETTCEDKSQPPAHNCDSVTLEWITNAGAHPPGQLNLEVVATDFLGHKIAERFFVVIPQQPPPDPEAPEVPDFASTKLFREDHGLDREKSMSQAEANRLVLELLYEWEAQYPAAVSAVNNWGVSMRAPELSEMEWRRQYVAQASEFIPQWAEEHAASAYGGFYVNEREGGKIYVGFTENQQALVAALKASGGLLNPEKVFEYPTPPTRSALNMEELEQAVVNALSTNSAAEEATTGLELSDDGKRIEVGATNPPLVEQFLQNQFGSSAPISVFARPAVRPFVSRYGTSGPIVGGSALRAITPVGTISRCTAGFGARSKAGELFGRPVYLDFVLTAGHCFEKGSSVSREAIQEELAGPIIGTVRRFGFHPSTSFRDPSTDGEGILLVNQELRSHSVLTGNPLKTETIQGVEPPKIGMMVCWSGISGGSHCGRILKKLPRIVDGRYVWVFKVEGPDAEGDSGAPVWEKSTNKAVGSITSGEAAWGIGKPCHFLSNKAEWCPRMLFTPLLPRPNRADPPGIVPTLGVEILQEG
ncbi:MAG: DUF6531 domain-containing protein [Solirubrobacterales bacterium]